MPSFSLLNQAFDVALEYIIKLKSLGEMYTKRVLLVLVKKDLYLLNAKYIDNISDVLLKKWVHLNDILMLKESPRDPYAWISAMWIWPFLFKQRLKKLKLKWWVNILCHETLSWNPLKLSLCLCVSISPSLFDVKGIRNNFKEQH